MREPEVSVLIVTFHSAGTIEACLAALRQEARRLPLEVIVVDNASRDDTVARIRAGFPEVTLVAEPQNRGFAWGSNRAARQARGRHLLLLNPDTMPRPRLAAELVRALDAHPGAALAGPRIEGARGRIELSHGREPGILTELVQKILGMLHERPPPLVGGWLAWRSRRARLVDWVSGAALLVRRRVWEELGGLDEGYFLYLEDVDLCTRARARGHEVLYWPRAEAYHAGGVSMRANPLRAALAYRHSQLRFYARHRSREALALLTAYLRAKLTLVELVAWVAGRREAARDAAALQALVKSFETGGEGEHRLQNPS